MRKLRIVLWGIVVLALVAAGFVAFGPSRQEVAEAVAKRPAIGGPFDLIDGHGRTVRDTDLHGKPFAIFFGFTHCPDVCPTALFEMSTWIDALGADADRLRFVFVSIDPERDTPEIMRAYAGSFSDRILPLAGSAEQVSATVRSYRVYARKVPLEGGDYTMDHSTMVYLKDAEGRYASHLVSGATDAESAVASLRALLRS